MDLVFCDSSFGDCDGTHMSVQDKNDIISALSPETSLPSSPGVSEGVTISFRAQSDILVANNSCIGLPAWCTSDEWAETLVELYFANFHPVFPIVEEYQLKQNRSPTSEWTKDRDGLLFNAVIFVAFGYISQAQLQRSPCRSIHEGQKLLFARAQALYHHHGHEYSEATLTQAAFLLSNWGPYGGEAETNRVWIGRALSHATCAGLNEGIRSLHHRLIWTCCLIRGRILALPVTMTPYSWITQYKAATIQRKDFEDDSTTATGSPLCTPLVAEAFILLARLSDILNDVISLRERHDAESCSPENGIPLWELLEVMTLADSVVAWERERSRLLSEYQTPWFNLRFCTMCHTLAMLKDAIMIELYQPYISLASSMDMLPTDILTHSFSNLALTQVEQSAHGIAAQVRELLETSAEDEIPLMIATWLPCPIFIFLLKLYTEPIQNRAAILRPFGDLLRLLFTLRARFSGAGFVSALVDELMRSLQDRLPTGRIHQTLEESQLAGRPASHDEWNRECGPGNMFTRNRDLTAFLRRSANGRPKIWGERGAGKAGIMAWGLDAIRQSFSMQQVRVI